MGSFAAGVEFAWGRAHPRFCTHGGVLLSGVSRRHRCTGRCRVVHYRHLWRNTRSLSVFCLRFAASRGSVSFQRNFVPLRCSPGHKRRMQYVITPSAGRFRFFQLASCRSVRSAGTDVRCEHNQWCLDMLEVEHAKKSNNKGGSFCLDYE